MFLSWLWEGEGGEWEEEGENSKEKEEEKTISLTTGPVRRHQEELDCSQWGRSRRRTRRRWPTAITLLCCPINLGQCHKKSFYGNSSFALGAFAPTLFDTFAPNHLMLLLLKSESDCIHCSSEQGGHLPPASHQRAEPRRSEMVIKRYYMEEMLEMEEHNFLEMVSYHLQKDMHGQPTAV